MSHGTLVSMSIATRRWRGGKTINYRRVFSAVNAPTSQMLAHEEVDVQLWGGTFYCYYRVSNHINLMTSTDAATWTERGNILTQSPAGTTNYLANPSFETGTTLPDSWTLNGAPVTRVTTDMNSGAYAVRIQTSAQTANCLSAPVAVTAGNLYKVGTYVKGTVSGAQWFVTVRWWSQAGGTGFISQTNMTIQVGTYSTWQYLGAAMLAPTGAVSATVDLRSVNGTGDVYFDDVSLVDGSWDEGECISPSLVESNGTYYLFYEGNDGTHAHVCYAQAASPLGPFTKMGRVLSGQGTGFESVLAGTPAATKIGNRFYLFYHGYDGTHDMIGLAWSDDLVTWTRHPGNPIMVQNPANSWESLKVAPSSVFVDAPNGYVYVAYEGQDTVGKWNTGIAYMKVSDLETGVLTEQSATPILQASAGWDNDFTQLPCIVENGSGGLYLFYSGHVMPGNSFRLGRTDLTWTLVPG